MTGTAFPSLVVTKSLIFSISILHIYVAKGLREYAYAAAEKLKSVDRLDAKEHKGKVGSSIFQKAADLLFS